MRKNWKRLASGVLAAMMAASMLMGCGGSKDNAASSSSSSSSDGGSSEAVEEITCMVWDRGNAAPGTTPEDNALTQWIQEQVLKDCNVKVKYVSVPRSGSDDKVNVMMAGGSAPDIIFTYEQSLFGDYTRNGGVADLTDSLAKYGDKINELIGDIQYMGQYEGKQYAIMKRRGFQIPRHVTYVRKDWCDAMGMDIPTTKDELIDYLYAVKEKNPGNVDGVIPWAMGGTTDTEKFYLNFVGSYVPELTDKDAFVYSESFIIFADGAIDGIREMNKLYNDGLISPGFAVDTTTDQYKQDVCAGKVGFMLDDSTNYFDYAPIMQASVEGSEFVPVNCLTLEDGSYRNPTEPLYGMYVMVPKTSEDKTDAVVKYLNWLADPEHAMYINYTPDAEINEAGVPIAPTEDEKNAAGYPGTCNDLNIVNDHFEFVDNREGQASSWALGYDFADLSWFEGLYDVCTTDQFLYPTVPDLLESEATYKSKLSSMCIEYVYKLISCDPSEFDSLQQAEYKKLVDAGLEKIFEERAAYYDENMAK